MRTGIIIVASLAAVLLVSCSSPTDTEAEDATAADEEADTVNEEEMDDGQSPDEVADEPREADDPNDLGEPEADDSATFLPDEEAGDVVKDYFDAQGRNAHAEMRDLSGGNAGLYAEYLYVASRADSRWFGQTNISTGRAPGDPVEVSDDQVTFDGEATMSAPGDPATVAFTDFVVEAGDDGWRLTDFERDGRPLADFVADPADAEAVTVNAVDMALTGLFHNPDRGIVVAVVDITNNREGEIEAYPWDATLVAAADGRQYSEPEGGGGGTVRPGATAGLIMAFTGVEASERAGTLRVSVTEVQSYDRYDLELDIPPFSAD